MNWDRISVRCWFHKRHTIARPDGSFVNICEKNDRILKALHCTTYLSDTIPNGNTAIKPTKYTELAVAIIQARLHTKLNWKSKTTLWWRHIGTKASHIVDGFLRLVQANSKEDIKALHNCLSEGMCDGRWIPLPPSQIASNAGRSSMARRNHTFWQGKTSQ